eukprot:14290933-Heterocapsa_arctica.AAC.1
MMRDRRRQQQRDDTAAIRKRITAVFVGWLTMMWYIVGRMFSHSLRTAAVTGEWLTEAIRRGITAPFVIVG